MLRIGIDLGGTKTEGIAIDPSGRELARRRRPTPRDDYQGHLALVHDLVTELEQAAGGGPATVGVGIPGAVMPGTGLIANANSTWLIGRPLDHDLAARLQRPVRLENDANCFAVSEAADGAGAGARVVFGVIIGTGCGGGIVIDGRPLTGRHAAAGEWGHMPLPWPQPDELPGPPCYCGKSGCVETWISGPGFAADHRRQSGEDLTALALADRIAAGDPAAVAALHRYADRLARSLAVVVDILDPDIVVLGGGLSNLTALYTLVPPLLQRRCFCPHTETPIRRARHGDSSGVRGAAWLWPAEPA